MDAGAPHPVAEREDDVLWVAYRTHRGDHFAVLRFSGVREFTAEDHSGKWLDTHPLYGVGLRLNAFHEVHDETLTVRGSRRWIATFPDEVLDVTASDVKIVVRAIQAQSTAHALAAVRGPQRAV